MAVKHVKSEAQRASDRQVVVWVVMGTVTFFFLTVMIAVVTSPYENPVPAETLRLLEAAENPDPPPPTPLPTAEPTPQVKPAKPQSPAKTAAQLREEQIENHFSLWDGSHKGLTKSIKTGMHNPRSYKHVETTYWDRGDHIVIRTTFRGTNAFGGVVTNTVTARADFEGNIWRSSNDETSRPCTK